jgi:hypothetical protein
MVTGLYAYIYIYMPNDESMIELTTCLMSRCSIAQAVANCYKSTGFVRSDAWCLSLFIDLYNT